MFEGVRAVVAGGRVYTGSFNRFDDGLGSAVSAISDKSRSERLLVATQPSDRRDSPDEDAEDGFLCL